MENYEGIEMEIIHLEQDIITTSGNYDPTQNDNE